MRARRCRLRAGGLHDGGIAWRLRLRDERGFTTPAMVVALLLTMSLVFSAGQVERVSSAASRVQDVADASALAAQNQVASFMLAARVCDAVVLSLALTGGICTGAGVACLCVPGAAAVGDALIEAGARVFDARDGFAERASQGLDRVQRVLPFLSALRASLAASANNGGAAGHAYHAIALLVQSEGLPLDLSPHDEGVEVVKDARGSSVDIKDAAKRAEEASREAADARERAFQADCGRAPSACMQERAASLASLPASLNPTFTSVDAWSFKVGLDRALAYYGARGGDERPADGSPEERMRSYLRQCFYEYATGEAQRSWVSDGPDGFKARLPFIPRNTEQMRQTSLYTDNLFPVGYDDEGAEVFFAYPGAPGSQAAHRWGSLAELEAAEAATVPDGILSVEGMGKVAAASTSVDNGFEYHFAEFCEALADYDRARHRLDPIADEVKGHARPLIDRVGAVMSRAIGSRIDPRPPGSMGCIALVVDASTLDPAQLMASPFVQVARPLGARVAIAGATMIEEPARGDDSALSHVLDGVRERVGSAAGMPEAALGCWSAALSAYAQGQEALIGGVSGVLDGLPLSSQSGLGRWAARALRDAVSSVGLQPADTASLKAVLVGTGQVASASSDEGARAFLRIKREAGAHPLVLAGPLSVALDASRQAVHGVFDEEPGYLDVASIEFEGAGMPPVPVRLPIPRGASAEVLGRADEAFERVRRQVEPDGGFVSWDR
ncbi:molybdenum cofactor biosynthesis enzyme [Eggerthellaceae bacterium zg-1084]|uniref:molybdenum cofactor biosynthesis enzyme n=1 Tax=Berryella wangjianweii TaxID=2734634 RepID=UPI001557C286|nr:molybdenum cofactor biosynthesis enzyme [Berryella wangjianweii]NPD30722.1 molybdenum cofactor biosynthesis enzyme [Berryella wangjianweii]